MESSRDVILKAVRSRPVPAAPLPGRFSAGIRYDDPLQQFAGALAAVGGSLIQTTELADAQGQLLATPAWSGAKKICSLVPGLGTSNVALDSIDDPHRLEDVDVAVLRGEFAVAENAAVWFPGQDLGRLRALPFITQHLVLVVPAHQIVHTMHEAYDRLRFDAAEFGVFISGPSKTADIEQSLVIGAHGPRSLTVLLHG